MAGMSFEDIQASMQREASFSPCRTWRYGLSRVWDSRKQVVMFIGLNPSSADETQDDPTIRRCIRYAYDWGYGGLVMMNLFAFRATDPQDMKAAAAPVGPENNKRLLEISKHRAVGIVIAGWGAHGAFLDREKTIKELIQPLHCLSITKDGHPGHPLYLKKDLKPVLYSGGAA